MNKPVFKPSALAASVQAVRRPNKADLVIAVQDDEDDSQGALAEAAAALPLPAPASASPASLPPTAVSSVPVPTSTTVGEVADTPAPTQFRRTTGTFTKPYRTKAGDDLVKWSLNVPHDLVQRTQAMIKARLPLGTTQSGWVASVVLKELERLEGEKS